MGQTHWFISLMCTIFVFSVRAFSHRVGLGTNLISSFSCLNHVATICVQTLSHLSIASFTCTLSVLYKYVCVRGKAAVTIRIILRALDLRAMAADGFFFRLPNPSPEGVPIPPPKNKSRREHTLAYMRAHGRNMRANRKGKPCGLFPMFLSVGRQLFGGTYYHPAAYALGVKALRPVWLHSSAI